MDRKKQILEVSAKLFRRRGYAATSMRDIARELDIEAPSLYNHISSKQELIRSLLMDVANQYVDRLKSTMELGNLDASEKLRLVIREHIEISFHNINAVSLIPTEYIHLKSPHIEEFRRLRDYYDYTFKSLLRSGMKEGLFCDLDVELTSFSILSTLRFLFSWIRKNPEHSVEYIQEQLEGSLLEGVMHSSDEK